MQNVNNFIQDHYNGIPVAFSKEDSTCLKSPFVKAKFDKYAFSLNSGNKVSQLFYLRGNKPKLDHNNMLIVSIEPIVYPKVLLKMVENVQFWNAEGAQCYLNNGEPHKESYNDFVFKCVAADARAFVKSNPEFITDFAGSHIWLADAKTKERVMIIHF